LLSFADLLSLVLTFFVMMYSTTAIQNEKWEAFINSFSKHFHITTRSAEAEPYLPNATIGPQEMTGMDLDYLKPVLVEKLAHYPELSRARVDRTRNRLLISVPRDALFNTEGKLQKDA